jgi:heat shock protein HslJ
MEAAMAPAGTYYVTHLLGKELATPSQGPLEITFLPEEYRVSGFSGCNRFFGGYSLEGDQLRFSNLAATKMACLGENPEQAFFEMTSRISRMEWRGSTLVLSDDSGELARLEPKK